MRRYKIDISLYYQEKGSGTHFVLLHGNSQDGSYFKHQIDFFSNNYRMIAVDTRGHGKSPRGNAPFNMNQFVEDLNNLLKKLELSQVILLVFSDGANIAMKFAIKYPEKIEALILDGGNLNTLELDLDLGAGETKIDNLNVTRSCDIDGGLGNINITLLGNKGNYQIEIDKGLGNISLDDVNLDINKVYGIGKDYIKIDGGIGNIKVDFEN